MLRLIGSSLLKRERTLNLRPGLDPRSQNDLQIQAIVRKDDQRERECLAEYHAAVAGNWKERRRIRRAA